MEQKETIHHGDFIRNVIERSELPLAEISVTSGYARSSIYRWFDEETLDMKKVHKIVMACGIDVTGELPELDYYREIHAKPTKKEESTNSKDTLSQEKYIQILEQLNETRQQLNEYQAKYYVLREKVNSLEKNKKDSDESGQ
ncbi:MAG: hypothetical protein R3220_09990 [Balneolaceae bacterium]|nr:hypothetical protein [Balneolaceae bacterium]